LSEKLFEQTENCKHMFESLIKIIRTQVSLKTDGIQKHNFLGFRLLINLVKKPYPKDTELLAKARRSTREEIWWEREPAELKRWWKTLAAAL